MRDLVIKLGGIAILCLAAAPAGARTIEVRGSSALASAVQGARAGDEIVLADGIYPISRKLAAAAAGTVAAPISVRAANRQMATILSSGLIAFEVTGPYWHFAGLVVRGVCTLDTVCEHAFHVVGSTDGFALTGSQLVDFNAHLKVNADVAHHLPAHGLVADNAFFDTHPRHTNNPVAPVNIDNAVEWVVRGNIIHDFQKDGTGEDSYGAFVKGGASAPLIEHNVVDCSRDRPAVGRMVGLSFGAHGMDPKLCPPHWDGGVVCDPEVQGGIIRNNIIRACNGEGIYLNRAAGSQVVFNTLENTGGILLRYRGTSADVHGNRMPGAVRAELGARVTGDAGLQK